MIVPSPSTSTCVSRWSAKAGTLVNSTCFTLPFSQRQRTSIMPAGASMRSNVSGSFIGTIPVSSATVATQMVFEPDMGGYSVLSIMT